MKDVGEGDMIWQMVLCSLWRHVPWAAARLSPRANSPKKKKKSLVFMPLPRQCCWIEKG